MPGFVCKHIAFCDIITLKDHPFLGTLLSYLHDRVDVHDYLIDSHKGRSCDRSDNVDRFPGVVLANHMPPLFTEFVNT